MSLIFEEDLSGGSYGGFDSAVATGTITYTGGAANFTIDAPTDVDTYLIEDTAIADSTPTVHINMDVKLDSYNPGGADKSICFLVLRDGINNACIFYLRANGGTRVDSITAVYTQNSGAKGEFFTLLADPVDNEYINIEIYYAKQNETGDSIHLEVKVDGMSLGTVQFTDQDPTAAFVDSIRVGNPSLSNNGSTRVLSIKNVKVAPTSAFNTSVDTYYVDPSTGDDRNAGTLNAPLKNAGPISRTMQAGETLYLMGGVHRVQDRMNGEILPAYSGTPNNKVVITGPGVITTAKGAGPSHLYELTASASNGEYYISLGGGNPNISDSAWIATGGDTDSFDELTRIYKDSGVVGSLTEGDFAYGDGDTLGFSTIYYKPTDAELAAGIGNLRIECVNASLPAIDFSTDHTVIDGVTVRYSGYGITDSGSNSGSMIINCDSGYNAHAAIHNNGGNSLIKANEVHRGRTHVAGSGSENGGGILVNNGSICTVQGNYCHDNGDDGIEVDGAGTEAKVYGNLLINLGLNSTDGSGLEVGSTVTLCEACNNTVSSCDRGLAFSQSTNITISNNIFYNAGGSALWFGAGVTMTNVTAESNCFYGTSAVNDGAATGTYSSTGDISDDPLFNEDYSLSKNSPCVGIGVKYWTGVNPIGKDGEPFSDIDTDIGAIQSTHGPFHPKNL